MLILALTRKLFLLPEFFLKKCSAYPDLWLGTSVLQPYSHGMGRPQTNGTTV